MTALRGQVTNGVHGLSPQHLHLSTSTAREGVSPRRDGSILTSDLGQFYGSSELLVIPPSNGYTTRQRILEVFRAMAFDPGFLLPEATVLRFDSIMAEPTGGFTVVVATVQNTAACPTCQQPMTRLHSHYTRTIADLP